MVRCAPETMFSWLNIMMLQVKPGKRRLLEEFEHNDVSSYGSEL